MNVRFYVTAAGQAPASKYLKGLDPVQHGAIADDLRLIERMGLSGSGVATKHIKGRLYEIKTKAQRVFYVIVVEPEALVVLHIYKKEGQKAPVDEIAVATKRMNDEIALETARLKKKADEEAALKK